MPIWAIEVSPTSPVFLQYYNYSTNIIKEVMKLLITKLDLYFNKIITFLTKEYNVYVSTEIVRRYLY